MTGQSERHKHHDKVRALLKETGVKLTHLRDRGLSRVSINAFRRGEASFMTLIKMEEAITLVVCYRFCFSQNWNITRVSNWRTLTDNTD